MAIFLKCRSNEYYLSWILAEPKQQMPINCLKKMIPCILMIVLISENALHYSAVSGMWYQEILSFLSGLVNNLLFLTDLRSLCFGIIWTFSFISYFYVIKVIKRIYCLITAPALVLVIVFPNYIGRMVSYQGSMLMNNVLCVASVVDKLDCFWHQAAVN